MIAAYLQHQAEREKSGIPALPLTPEQTEQVCQLLLDPPQGQEALLLSLLTDRVSPGVDPSAKVKAGFLAEVVFGRVACPLITPAAAIKMLATMLGGYNVAPMVAALQDESLAKDAAEALGGIRWSMTLSMMWPNWPARNAPRPAR